MSHAPALWILPMALVGGGCSDKPEDRGGVGCTNIGCQDGFGVDFTPNAAWGAGSYEFVVSLDGVTTTCTGSLPLPACGTSALTCSPNAERVMISESGCALAPDSHGFAGLGVLPPNPQTVTLQISRDGTQLVEQSWTPSYQTLQPNGPQCEPTCVFASDALTVPL